MAGPFVFSNSQVLGIIRQEKLLKASHRHRVVPFRQILMLVCARGENGGHPGGLIDAEKVNLITC